MKPHLPFVLGSVLAAAACGRGGDAPSSHVAEVETSAPTSACAGDSLTDSAGNVWSITSAGAVAVDGTAFPETHSVIELVYIGGVVWQETSAGLWWGKASPKADWLPAEGTQSPPAPDLQACNTPPPASSPSAAAPGPAAAVGYDTMTFGSGVNVGDNWYTFGFYGADTSAISYTTNPDGSISIHPGGDNYGGQLSTAQPGTPFSGTAFGGGAYFEAVMSFTGPASFWANDIETMNGVSTGAGPHQWPGQPAGYGDWVEVDMAEFDSPGEYGFTIHNWYGMVGSGDDANIGAISGSPASPANADYTQPNTYGCLWVPATDSTQGRLAFFFNGQQVSNTTTWNKYDPSRGPAPSVDDGTTGAVLDQLHLALILGAGSSTDNTVYSVRVWQSSADQNITH